MKNIKKKSLNDQPNDVIWNYKIEWNLTQKTKKKKIKIHNPEYYQDLLLQKTERNQNLYYGENWNQIKNEMEKPQSDITISKDLIFVEFDD